MKISNFIKIFVLLILLSSCVSKKNATATKNTSSSNYVLKSKKNSLDDFAKFMNIEKKDLKNEKLYFYIDNWLGTPHKMGGTTKSGIDCSGFVSNVYTEIYNEKLPRTSREMADQIKSKKQDKLKEGDLVFFAFGGGKIDHVGIYLHNNRFVHVSSKKGVIISNLEESWYSKYFVKSGSIL
ncbi:C40 family peptidase [Flavobacterium sp. I3-2]|uniref:C40 family peptidase n=1 Tax=Flavobacterium sp. I3-2 TaxID=2748319 RepID=UPI0015B1035F|nr:NlpC/P60 family protein [Flavobacterium sp. I3-2]